MTDPYSQPPPDENSEDEESDDGDEDVADLPPMTAMKSRSSVSAEAFGEWNQRAHYQAPEYPKTPEQMYELQQTLSGSFLFSPLDPADLQVIILAMKGPLVYDTGMRIIQEGDRGDALYVVEDGIFDCAKVIDGQELVVKTCMKGDLFGELALLYNAPRAASVVPRQMSTVWELDRETFNNIALEAVQRKRTALGSVLRSVPLLATVSDGEVENIIDALKLDWYVAGTPIIQQGEFGELFFIVYNGYVTASKVSDDGSEPTVMHHQAGDYFGELALLQNTPRAATVIAATDVQLLSMDRATFKRLMGPMHEFLERGMARYE